MEYLPIDILRSIIEYLDYIDISRLIQVSKTIKCLMENYQMIPSNIIKIKEEYKEVIEIIKTNHASIVYKMPRWNQILFSSRIYNLENEIQCARDKFKNILLSFKREELYKKRKAESFKIIMNIFGGKQEYEKLPIFDLSQYNKRSDYIDYIHARDLSAPIMRGIDKNGRRFFTIRFYNVENNEGSEVKYHGPYCETIFERYSNNGEWTRGCSNYSFLKGGGYLIDEGEINEKTYKCLCDGIRNRNKKSKGVIRAIII
jgi:hypothetical protein